ncbi:23S rRNA (guanosine(2251)-2'-O)-methyltransferase RlmB [Muriicola soli]|uniref:23S rRNA (Guanosine(2251)-2'-O)-methyltransferase RlmB n=1 Tax=Muriicola soli TaxID=2507538 RepID=A0A411EBG6_9FLAO|nr:23S rRNA (guanosine(2251)-2'-O)-methyltransferase RlmB [Muriicola soli]QBA64873.1 23S rRNA (guanosine(2251)-2'-O)-methyltransferase RlmB [Muriicola soli]
MSKNTQIYGIRAVIEAIQANEPIDKVYIQKGLKGSLSKELENLVRKAGIPASFVPLEKINKLSQNNHQGVVATISPISFETMESLVDQVLETKDNPLFLLLDGISDVRNLGAIIRTAECSGVNGIIIPKKGSAPITGDTVKTSAGAVFNIPLAKTDHIKDAVFYLKASGVLVVAATEKTNHLLYDLDLKGPTAIIMGAEDTGISPSILKESDHVAKLPLMGGIGSLNVSVACGIFLFEVVRQRMG